MAGGVCLRAGWASGLASGSLAAGSPSVEALESLAEPPGLPVGQSLPPSSDTSSSAPLASAALGGKGRSVRAPRGHGPAQAQATLCAAAAQHKRGGGEGRTVAAAAGRGLLIQLLCLKVAGLSQEPGGLGCLPGRRRHLLSLLLWAFLLLFLLLAFLFMWGALLLGVAEGQLVLKVHLLRGRRQG